MKLTEIRFTTDDGVVSIKSGGGVSIKYGTSVITFNSLDEVALMSEHLAAYYKQAINVINEIACVFDFENK